MKIFTWIRISFFSRVLVLDISSVMKPFEDFHEAPHYGWQMHEEGIVTGVLLRLIFRYKSFAKEEQVMTMYFKGVSNDWTVGWPQDTGVGSVFITDYIPIATPVVEGSPCTPTLTTITTNLPGKKINRDEIVECRRPACRQTSGSCTQNCGEPGGERAQLILWQLPGYKT